MKGRLASFNSVFNTFLASICCLGLLVLAGFGAGIPGLAMSLTKFRPYFIALTLVSLGVGFYLVYGRRQAAYTDGAGYPTLRRNRVNEIILWISAVLAIGLIAALSEIFRNCWGRRNEK